MNRIRITGVIVGVIIVIGGSWILYRASTLGILNVFSREHIFADSRPLTEEVAVEFTGKSLESDGYDTAKLGPVEYWPSQPNQPAERLFARNTLNQNDGYVLWGPKNTGTWEYYVSIEIDGGNFRWRVCRPK